MEDSAQKRAENMCARDTKKKEDYRELSADYRSRLNKCQALKAAKAITPLALKVSAIIFGQVTAASAGACVGLKCPPEATAVLATSSVASLVGLIILELLDRKERKGK